MSAALRRKRAELRSRIRAQRKAAKAKLALNPLVKEQRLKRRLRNAIIGAGVLALLLAVRCECGEAPPPEPVALAPEAPKEKPAPKPKPKPKPKPLNAAMDPQGRGTYSGEPRDTGSWIDDYRLQVAARSARLSSCFTGIEKPGALRWTASVNTDSGAVSDHELEALASTMPIWKKEKECLIGVLSSPPYKIKGAPAQEQGVPNRVSIVIEF